MNIVPRLGLFALVALLVTFPAQAQLVISEFLAANSTVLSDQDGEYSDWIELQNTGKTVLNLAGWTLTDDPTRPTRWTLPATNLNAGAYLVVFASGKDRSTAGAELHANFSLNADGEYLALFPPDSTQPTSEFAPAFPVQKPDISFGLSGGQNLYFAPPTPRAANGTGFADFVADTQFSHRRGIYDQAFDLTITCATPGATLRYTTNGAPPSATTGMVYASPLRISGTTVIRVAAFKTGLQPSSIDTQTYLFPEDIFKQSPTGQAPPGWPTSWGGNVVNYGMDPDVVNSATYKNELLPALKSLPIFVLVTELKNLFDPATGIYANASQDGRAWERPASIELIHPNGNEGFQMNCGVRVRGGFSRSSDNPKHALRLFFREEYGKPKLRYPLFGDNGTDTFDNFDLRTFQNYSWSFQGDARGVFFRDQFSRDTQLALGSQAERGNYYHLFINGQYWGIYNTCERPEASYGASYFGGNKEDFDVIKVEAGPYTINATDGNMTAWTTLYNALKTTPVSQATYQKLQGNDPDGTPNPAYPVLLEVDNLIDYQLVIYFGGNLDAPISWFLGESSPNNFYGMRDRTGRSGGFKFFAHDAEHTLLNVGENRTGPFSAGSASITKSNPQYFFQQLASNPEFRIRAADRIHRAFFNGGALTPEANRARVARRTNEIYSAVVLESARWGDSKRAAPFTRNAEWLTEVNRIQNSYFSQRSSTVLGQFRSKGWYPAVVAPSFSQHGGPVAAGARIQMTAPEGTIYYTTDGTDPRLTGGEVARTARLYFEAITLSENTRLKARVRGADGAWSALNAADFQLIQNWTDVQVTELMYRPPNAGSVNGDDLEFLELKNVGGEVRDLSGVRFTQGVLFQFPQGTRIAPGQILVLASQEAAFTNRYPGVKPFGIYSGRLSNSGESLTLLHTAGGVVFDFAWSDAAPWPTGADGAGFSLVPKNPNIRFDPKDPSAWRASARIGGSPGQDDPVSQVPPIQIHELLTHTDPPQSDSVELYNPTGEPVSLAGWFLTDDRNQPRKFRIPESVLLQPYGYAVLTEADFNKPGAMEAFTFSSHGEEVFLFSADPSGNLTGHADGFRFEAAANGVSFGRYTNSVGELQFPAQKENTLGRINAGPRIGPVVLNEFSFDPIPGDVEYVQVKNLSKDPVPLFDPAAPTNTWKVGGLEFSFPMGLTLPPGGLAVVVTGDPTLFRLRQSIPDSVPVLGPATGNLSDSGERLELRRPDSPDSVTNELGQVSWFVPEIVVDAVRYGSRAPWPDTSVARVPALERFPADAYGDDPAHWRVALGGPSPGFENNVNRPPKVLAGEDQSLTGTQFPWATTVTAVASDDGQPGGSLQYQWTQVGGPSGVVFDAPSSAKTQVLLPGQGSFTLRVTVSDGEMSASDEVVLQVTRSAGVVALLPAGSVWKYNDQGRDLGNDWREPGFDDSGWKSGKAQLGYGDGDEVTALGFGPDGNNKFITTYFRSSFTLSGKSEVTDLTMRLVRDDGAVVYLNGVEVARSNLPEGAITFSSLANSAVGGADESNFFEFTLDRSALRDGINVVAVELHQSGGGSSDISFDLEMNAMRFPTNTAPTADAGPDVQSVVGAVTLLTGTFTDDGLPQTPGVPSFTWSQVQGPGVVSFSNPSTPRPRAVFPVAGEYILRFEVQDGAGAATDEVRVTVVADVSTPVVITLQAGANPGIRFTTEPDRSYSILMQARLDGAEWIPVKSFPATSSAQVIEMPLALSESMRFYRVVSPAVP